MKKYLVFLIFLILISSAFAVVDSEINFDENDEVSVIIILKESQKFDTTAIKDKKSFLEQKKSSIKQQQDKVIDRLTESGFSVKNKKNQEKFHRFSTINGFTGQVTQDEFDLLKNDPDVEAIFLDKTFSVNLNDSTHLINSDSTNNIIQDYSIDLTGTGQTVCVIDTGIDYTHSALGNGWGNRVIDGYDFCGNGGGNIGTADCNSSDSDPLDNNGHGTHVAGIIGSSDSTYPGVAPEIDLVALKACDSDGDCSGSAMLASIDWCNNNSVNYNITVISMSIGDGNQYNSSTCPNSFDSAINTAVGLGITFVVSSGNNGHKNGISLPACSPNSTSVGSVGKDDSIPSYSNSGSLLDLLAPGGISSSQIRSLNNGGGYADLYGTSMAAPHVAGAVALLNQYKKIIYNNTCTSAEIENILKNTGINKTDSNSVVTPRIDVYAAVLSLDNTTPIASYISPTPSNNSQTPYNSVTVKINSSETVNATLVFDGLNYVMSLDTDSVYQKTISSLAKGNHSFMVSFSDLAGNNNSLGTYYIIVNNSAPNITSYTPSSTNVSVNEQSSLLFNHTSTDAENNTLSYSWYLNNSLQASTSYWNFNPDCNDAGSYLVELIVSDSYINDSQSWNLLVNNTDCAPIASITSPVNNANLELGSSISFTTNSTDPENGNLTYLWDFGDSSTSNQTNLSHQYSSVNTFTVTLNVTDSSNLSDTTSINVNVSDTTAPTFNLVSYSSPIYSNDNLYITTNITDYSNILNVTLTYNSNNLAHSQNNDIYSWVITDPSDGDHTFLLKANDTYSNAQSNSYSFTVDYCGDGECQSSDESCTSCSSDCGSCNGGGGGGGGSSTTQTFLPSKTFIYSLVSAGSSYELLVNNDDIPFTTLNLKPLASKQNIMVIVSVTQSQPSTLGHTYKYLEIEMVNLEDSEISPSFIQFKVLKSWFTSGNYDPNKVSLYRYTDQWDKLTTSLLREDSSYYYYQAHTLGFSFFAIVAEKLPPTLPLEELPAAEPTFAVQEAGAESKNIDGAATTESLLETQDEFKPWYLLLLIPAVFIIVLVVYFTKHKKPEEPIIPNKPLGQKKGEILDNLVELHEEDENSPEEPLINPPGPSNKI